MISAIPQTIDGELTWLIVFIQDGETLVGSVQIRTRNKVLARLHSLYVDENYRRKGVASQLMRHAGKIAMREACEGIGLHLTLQNIGIRSLYEKLGYTAVYQFDDGDVQFIKRIIPFQV